MTSPIIPNLDPTILVFSDNGNLAELTGNRPIFVDREKFIAAMNEGNLSSGAILLKPNTDSTVGQLEAVFIGTRHSNLSFEKTVTGSFGFSSRVTRLKESHKPFNVFRGTGGTHWVSWRRGNESLETFLNRTDKLDARFDEVTNR